ncbi:MAG: type II toxin-antitoxin system VapC family toxin [Methanobrevibacter sp.]|uniref:type II toxin-antitoxin system VapC family toxin n=1 Tax=Methanobrevibacter sp. TaxID=66852 RepID=UPI0025E1834A|nr:type II toxin-antitoxin system VapC family toxin [Methanobrevibacter sp.]MBE6496944.1 type II toxin-antitoxin system VapC family toxin [Methanobrevibacter sp.]
MIFLDTSYINGLILNNDNYASLSRSMRPFLKNERKVTNITVLLEVLNSINKYNFFGDLEYLKNQLINLNVFDFLTCEDYESAFELFKFYNKSLNFADCTILQTMQNHGISRIASFDSDFDKIKGIERIYGFY